MIEINEVFSDSDKRLAWWCETVADTNDLALMAENVIQEKVRLISVPAENQPRPDDGAAGKVTIYG